MEKEICKKCDTEHLKIIEEIIARLANNAFILQNWFITVFCGLLAIYFQKDTSFASGYIFLLGTIVIASFYFMNVQYLWLERCYREKYNEVRLGKCENFDLNIAHLKKSNFRSKYISFTFTIYLLALVCLFVCIVLKDPEVFCKLLCL